MKTIQIYDDSLTRTTPISVPDDVEVTLNKQSGIVKELREMNASLSSKIDTLKGKIWKERIISFILGVLASMVASMFLIRLGIS